MLRNNSVKLNMVLFCFINIGKRVDKFHLDETHYFSLFMNPALFLVLASINKRSANLVQGSVQCLVQNLGYPLAPTHCALPAFSDLSLSDDAIANAIYMAVINQLKRIFQVRTNPRDFDRKHHFQTSPC